MGISKENLNKLFLNFGKLASRIGIFSVLSHDELDSVLHVLAVDGPRPLVVDPPASPLGLLIPETPKKFH